jgi:hypothetical protein
MHDDDRPKTAPPGGDDEQAEALSRAARDAVRQPADPRLEKSFAKLGLFGDEEVGAEVTPRSEAAADHPQRQSPVVGTAEAVTAPPPAALDLSPVVAQLATLEAATERLERRMGMATSLLIGLSVVVGVLAVLLLVRT